MILELHIVHLTELFWMYTPAKMKKSTEQTVSMR
jgi:hypothetical protein